MLNIPNEQLPEEWKNEERITVLYSPLRSRTVNPKDWDTRLTSWKNLIYLYCLNNKFYKFTRLDLNKQFLRNGRPPNCLNLIINELIKMKELMYMDEYLEKSSTTQQTWSNWLTDVLIRKPLLWPLNSLITTNTNDNKMIIHCKVVREESQVLYNKIPKKMLNKLINLQQLLEIINEDQESIENIKLLLIDLKQQQKIDFTEIDNYNNFLFNFLIKFGQNQSIQITEIDISIYVLEQNEQLFIQTIEQLEDEINRILNEIKTRLLTTGHRQLAKANLRKKHEIQKRLDRKLNALQNIQILLEKLRDIQTDTQLWDAYKQALVAFNRTFKETGLSEDKVEDTILELEEMLEISDNVQGTLTKPLTDNTIGDDDDELEKELEELMNDESKIDDLTGELSKLKLPDVPSVEQSKLTEELQHLQPSQSSLS